MILTKLKTLLDIRRWCEENDIKIVSLRTDVLWHGALVEAQKP